jgi:hypothetical protein
MKIYSVRFDDSDDVVVEPGIEIEGDDAARHADLGSDVGGATLAMIPLRIPLVDIDPSSPHLVGDRILAARIGSDDDGKLWFLPEADAERTAFVVLSVIQRSPDARTEVQPFGAGVECIGNAFERPMDRQLLVMQPDSSVQFRRFSRGGENGPWQTVRWDGTDLHAERAPESASGSD